MFSMTNKINKKLRTGSQTLRMKFDNHVHWSVQYIYKVLEC
jgi:hypothetical protein